MSCDTPKIVGFYINFLSTILFVFLSLINENLYLNYQHTNICRIQIDTVHYESVFLNLYYLFNFLTYYCLTFAEEKTNRKICYKNGAITFPFGSCFY